MVNGEESGSSVDAPNMLSTSSSSNGIAMYFKLYKVVSICFTCRNLRNGHSYTNF